MKYNEAFAHICTGNYFLKESLNWDLPEDVKAKLVNMIAELEAIKADLEAIE